MVSEPVVHVVALEVHGTGPSQPEGPRQVPLALSEAHGFLEEFALIGCDYFAPTSHDEDSDAPMPDVRDWPDHST